MTNISCNSNVNLGTQSNPVILDTLEVVGLKSKTNILNTNLDSKVPDEIEAYISTPTAIDMVEQHGGKLQQREVNGVKQQIAIIKNGKNEMKFLVNADGTLGEELVTLSTFGKNKYITKSEHNRKMDTIFPTGIPEGIEVKYAYQDGIYHPQFLKDGKVVSNSDLREYIAQLNQKSEQNIAQL